MKEVFRAIHSAELEDFFRRLGVFEKFNEGELRCHVCGVSIDTENFGAVTRKGGALLFLCSKETCMSCLFSAGEQNGDSPG